MFGIRNERRQTVANEAMEKREVRSQLKVELGLTRNSGNGTMNKSIITGLKGGY